MSRLEIHLLGAPNIEKDGRSVEPDTRKAIALVAYLVMSGERHTRDALAVLFWPDFDQARGRAALRRTLSALKAAVDGYGLDIQRDTLAIDSAADIWVDALAFRELIGRCQEHGHPRNETCPACLTPLTQAATMYQGDFMSGFTLRDSAEFDQWQYLEGEGLRREMATVYRNLILCHLPAGQFKPAIEYAYRWLAMDPLHEPAHRQLMRLLAYDGQRSAAIRQYRECVRILEEELGVSPLDETTELYQAIMAGTLVIPDPTVPFQPTAEAQATPEPASPMPLPLVGRAAELASISEWFRGMDENGRLLAVSGEAGIGKTRLAHEFANQARNAGALVISSQCYEGESLLAYSPLVDGLRNALARTDNESWLAAVAPNWLAEAARLLPDLPRWQPDLPPVPPLDGPGAQSRFFEGVRQMLVGLSRSQTGCVLLLDDLNWADEATLELLAYLLRRFEGLPLFLLVTWRESLLPEGHRLRQAVNQAVRSGSARRIKLDRLGEAAVGELVRSRPDLVADPGLPERLYRETEGLPFFVAEYLAAVEAGAGSGTGQAWPMPGTVRDLLRSRLTPVSQTGRQLLHAGAVIGRSFAFETVRQASGRGEEEVVVALEELMDLGLIMEQPGDPAGPIYDFVHEKLRTLVYEETSLARRRLLHRRAAEAMVAHPRSAAPAASIAHHYRQAGLDELAADHFRVAGDEARALYANAEALAHYQAALDAGHPDTAALSEAVGDMCTLLGNYDAALTSYETAAALNEKLGASTALARVEHRLGNVHQRLGQWEIAGGQYRQALEHAPEASSRARLLADWSLASHHGGQTMQAQELARQAMALADEAQDLRAKAQTHNILGILANSRGDLGEAARHLEESLALSEQMADPVVRAAALNNLSLVSREASDFDRARQAAEKALDLCVELGDRHRQAALHNNLADIFHAAGDAVKAMSHLKKAVAIYAEIGGEAGDWRPEIWKLTEW